MSPSPPSWLLLASARSISATLHLGVALLFAGDYDEGVALIERADAKSNHDLSLIHI